MLKLEDDNIYAGTAASGGGGGGSSTKYGATAGTFLGDVNDSGILQPPSEDTDVVFTGVKDVAANALRQVFSTGANSGIRRVTSVSFPDLTTISGQNALIGLCQYNSALTSVSFPKLATITGGSALQSAFMNCSGLTSIAFPALTSITSGYALQTAFNGCGEITSISFPELTILGGNTGSSQSPMGNCFGSCTKLASIDFPKLEKVGWSGFSYAFAGCPALTSVTFPKLNTIFMSGFQRAFQTCAHLTSISFPSLTSTFNLWGSSYTNCFDNMLNTVTGCTVHFPSNLQSVIGSWSDVTNGFGGTNTTVLFDLPATE